ncbi:1,4-dihydroxy-2-naphthoyl-CoA thioesterase 1-like [Iris pallida]|uniref:1,4-dihydroxy-2-naphthoyl-CoA thioesterase 1-like n=1 Tax=Iris pallida TaxID=29817 RepID=A0AAX6ENN7_IRIPA|nr:1,4-dihydroxy-2-naphthoyl-CoA thioesterase 1-like [Iris pallida]
MPSDSKTAELDAPLHAIGFAIDLVSPNEVNGSFTVTGATCQPFKVLHGGISALVAEALASIGAHTASGFKRIAGIQLCINHHRTARLGDRVFASAKPVQVGKTIQVWEVHLWKIENDSDREKKVLIASSKVTFLSNMPVPQDTKNAGETLRKYAKL